MSKRVSQDKTRTDKDGSILFFVSSRHSLLSRSHPFSRGRPVGDSESRLRIPRLLTSPSGLGLLSLSLPVFDLSGSLDSTSQEAYVTPVQEFPWYSDLKPGRRSLSLGQCVDFVMSFSEGKVHLLQVLTRQVSTTSSRS